MNNLVEGCGELTNAQLFFIVVSIFLSVLIVGYHYFLRENVDVKNQLQTQLEQKIREFNSLPTIRVFKHNAFKKIVHINLFALSKALDQKEISSAVINETEPIMRGEEKLCAYNISASMRFSELIALIEKLNYVDIKSLEINPVENSSPYLTVKMEVVGFCEKK